MKGGSELIIFGAGGHALKIVDIARSSAQRIVGYISTEDSGSILHGIPVLGDLQFYKRTSGLHGYGIHIAIGENSIRYEVYKSIGTLRDNLIKMISTRTILSEHVTVGRGTCILQNVTIQPRVKLGKCSIVDTGAVVEHECEVGDFVNVSPGAVLCGRVRVGHGAIIGAGAIVIEKVCIGANSLIGAGSVVTQDIGNNCVAVGNPARVIRKRSFTDKYLR